MNAIKGNRTHKGSTVKSRISAAAAGCAVAALSVMMAICLSACGSGSKSNTASSSASTRSSTSASSTSSQQHSSASKSSSKSSTKNFADTLGQFGAFDPVTVEGSGDDVIDIPCAGKPCLMSVTYSGAHNFVVEAIDSDGSMVDLLVNTIGSYDGTVTDYQRYKKATNLQIESSGPWSVTFFPMSAMTQATNGYQGSGDDVVYIDEPKITKLHFTNSAEHNFVVMAIGMSKSDLLVNEIGSYDGTVSWSQNQSFLIVNSSGNWTVSW